jgi:hypothetical protein
LWPAWSATADLFAGGKDGSEKKCLPRRFSLSAAAIKPPFRVRQWCSHFKKKGPFGFFAAIFYVHVYVLLSLKVLLA